MSALGWWFVGLGVAVVVVLIAAALILAILTAARNIERNAGAGLTLVEQIREQTQVIWALQETNKVAIQLRGGAESILGHAGQIAQALHDADNRRGRG